MSSGTVQHHDALSGAHRRTGLDAHLAHYAGRGRKQRDFHFHRLQDDQHITGGHPRTNVYLHLPEVAGDVAVDAQLTLGQQRIFAWCDGRFFTVEVRLATGDPALALGVEGALLLLSERGDAVGFLHQKRW